MVEIRQSPRRWVERASRAETGGHPALFDWLANSDQRLLQRSRSRAGLGVQPIRPGGANRPGAAGGRLSGPGLLHNSEHFFAQ